MTTMTITPAPTQVPTCKRGHELNEGGEHLYVSPRGRRACRTCENARKRDRPRTRSRGHMRETLTHVSNEPLRERFLQMEAAGEITANALALHLGWLPPAAERKPGRGDTQRVKRALGIAVNYEGRDENGERAVTRRVTMLYATAVAIAHALGMDPFEAGV